MAPTRAPDVDLTEDVPSKRQKANDGHARMSQTGYDSANDDGDDIFQDHATIATLLLPDVHKTQMDSLQFPPDSLQHITQPTQILEKAGQPQSKPNQGQSVTSQSTVQVTASSPLAAPSVLSPTAMRNPPRSGGILASAMAPPGTAFRPPYGVRRAPLKPPVIDISDDDGPTYQGDSSDELESDAHRIDIKPSTFAKSGRSDSAQEKLTDFIQESPISGPNKFKDITSNSFYNPADKKQKSGTGFSGSVYDSRNRDDQNSTSQFTASSAPKRTLDSLASGYGNASRRLKQSRQTGPDRARPVQDIGINDFLDLNIRSKAAHIKDVFPNVTYKEIQDALTGSRGHLNDALSLIASKIEDADRVDLTGPDRDELTTDPSQTAHKITTKRQVKAPSRTIQDKYSSAQTASRPALPAVTATPPKPKRKLIQRPRTTTSSDEDLPNHGATNQASSHPISDKPIQKDRRRNISDDSDDFDSGIESSEDDTVLHDKVLEFLNTCSVKDLGDIANVDETVAETLLSKKPFTTLDEVREISTETSTKATKGKRKSTKRPIGDRIVNTCLDMWTGYEAIDDLVKKCENLGKPIAKAMEKWGVNAFGSSKDGELQIVSLGDDLDETHTGDKSGFETVQNDSGIGSPSDVSSPPNGSNDVSHRSRTVMKNKNGFLAQPEIMSSDIVLKDYQLVGLNWLTLMFDLGLSCILADDMGLGKTCQVISFLSHLLEANEPGVHLVVVPGSTLENWLREFQRFSPSLVVEPYYGLEKERAEQRLAIEENIKNINVIVTTYDLASKKVDSVFLRRLKPTVCVYDEGHALKNSTSQRYAALMRIPAKFRLLLTGTPLQNNLKELAALLGFILPSVFNEKRNDLDFIFKHKAKTADDHHGALLSAQRIARAKSMMTPFVLRRKKHQVLKHLPAKTCRVEYCDMTEAQIAIYTTELESARHALAERAAGRKAARESANVMMQLRKAAIHPMLFRRLYTDKTIKKMSKDCLKEFSLRDRDPDIIYEDMEVMTDFELRRFCDTHPDTMAKYTLEGEPWMDSGKVAALAALLTKWRANGDRVLVFSQFTMVLDVLEPVLDTLGLAYLRFDGQTSIDKRQDMIDQFHSETDITVFLLSTRAGGMGVNLACANKVVLFDMGFNPQDDVQAENRAHRVGQTREVEVVRLVSRGTIEEGILRLGRSKLVLDERVSGEGGEEVVVEELVADGAGEGAEEAEKKGMEAVEKMLLEGKAG